MRKTQQGSSPPVLAMGSRLLVVALFLPACGGIAGLRAHGKDAGQGGNVGEEGGVGAGGSSGASATGGSGPAASGGAVQTGGIGSTGGVTGALVTLTVSFAGKGAGTVLIQPGDAVCTAPTTCTASFASGTPVTLTAKPTNAGATVTSVLSGWDGACAGNGPYRLCTLTMNAATSTAAHFDSLPANLVFVTSSVFAGNLGGAAAYQRQCNQLATAAGINNAAGDAYVAWMAASDYACDVAGLDARMGARGPAALDRQHGDGSGHRGGLLSGGLRRKRTAVIGDTLSGMSDTDKIYAGENCTDWTDATVNASHGHTHAGGRGWPSNNVGVASCAIASRVICVMKGASTPVAVTPVAGKKLYQVGVVSRRRAQRCGRQVPARRTGLGVCGKGCPRRLDPCAGRRARRHDRLRSPGRRPGWHGGRDHPGDQRQHRPGHDRGCGDPRRGRELRESLD